ncbi:MAG: cell division protein ZapA [Deltaproteobacteria bacterium]|nr:cell division protein ZapA [Deltaproteobacteria bacterium]
MAGYIKLNILGKEYSIKSNLEEKSLNQISEYLNHKVTEVLKTTKTVATNNILILTAMNIANDYFQEKNLNEEIIATVDTKSGKLIDYIDSHT